jgi:hypothetical protein
MRRLVLTSLGLLLALACTDQRASSSPPNQSAPSAGRYVFYPEPTTSQAIGSGYLLDTATGDMWTVVYEMTNGQMGPRVLVPMERRQPAPRDIPKNPYR